MKDLHPARKNALSDKKSYPFSNVQSQAAPQLYGTLHDSLEVVL